jgi:transmembrane sensor
MSTASPRLQKDAARWFMRMRDAEPDHPDRSRFEAWLLSDPAHANEYAAFAETWEDFDSTPKLQSLAQAMRNKKDRLDAQRSRLEKITKRGVLGLMLLAVSGLFGHQMWREWRDQPLMELASVTGIGQIGRQTLEDGTQLVLNADTSVRITYYRNKRQIVMERGEVIFDVARDPKRPFVVESGQARVTVLGTRFAVNRLEHLVRVSVDHGRVKVESQHPHGDTFPGHVILTDGQVAEVWQGDEPRLVQRSASDAFSFQNGAVVFQHASLGEIAETLSRYRSKPLLATRGTTLSQNVTAVVQIREIEDFLKLLPRIAPVRIEEAASGTRIEPLR